MPRARAFRTGRYTSHGRLDLNATEPLMPSLSTIVTPADLAAYLAAIESHYLAASLMCATLIGGIIAWRQNTEPVHCKRCAETGARD